MVDRLRRCGWKGLALQLVLVVVCAEFANADDGLDSNRPPEAGAGTETVGLLAPAEGSADLAADSIIPAKVRRYAQKVRERYDNDGSGRLEPQEWARLPIQADPADSDRNGVLTTEELTRILARYGQHRRIRLSVLPPLGNGQPQWQGSESRGVAQGDSQFQSPSPNALNPVDPNGPTVPPSGNQPKPASGDPGASVLFESAAAVDGTAVQGVSRRDQRFFVPSSQLPEGLPEWYMRRDGDGDGQLTLAEFAPRAGNVDVARFSEWDLNGDGVITATECVRASKSADSGQPADTGAPRR